MTNRLVNCEINLIIVKVFKVSEDGLQGTAGREGVSVMEGLGARGDVSFRG